MAWSPLIGVHVEHNKMEISKKRQGKKDKGTYFEYVNYYYLFVIQ